ncbi:hypothetical protein PtrSN002B_003673 [Pyrenophora tritici-repentis]|uniref:Uncharacterized protein n=2 Tax=Pyrenophora tritici-repentis TaxID=45151 RepID=A0A2W1I1B4_9PLEO|nr:uncharacterized protein PTRG_03858 [Pyrenophora tritici-repentis Pt-1C-BFP]KAA8620084.1 hypothetical protein PtrV1_07178 [Pyrenophora tritici-repentis]EDU46696.1 hypothetical protein PTRG_03858 [Pyrenophora tritici-repentis Pt-1C-BFP]KAF7448235.1 hypothetical protein A1F99_075990 [Pyrenophora tritici-repentis]KAF7571949.1 hypothetical protein PtrM4_094490 [Pyrenophora tritici-repentis]KAG9384863.1 hypothetical protein A1F94_004410 [Pyrenophora tritici-repentis]
MECTQAATAVSNKMRETDRIMRENQVNSPLLRLPAELREEIFKYALTDGKLVIGTQSMPVPKSHSPHGVRALLYTCRQILQDAAPLVFPCCVIQRYRMNVFDLTARHENMFIRGRIENFRIPRGHLIRLEYMRRMKVEAGRVSNNMGWMSLKRLFLERGTKWTIEEAEVKFRWYFGRENLEILWVDED